MQAAQSAQPVQAVADHAGGGLASSTTAGRSPWRPLAVISLVLVLAALVAVGGDQRRDPREGEGDGFDRVLADATAWFAGEQDERGNFYRIWYLERPGVGPRTISLGYDYVRVGAGPYRGSVVKSLTAKPGFSRDYVRPVGSALAYQLVGDRYLGPVTGMPGVAAGESLLRTNWLSYPVLVKDTAARPWDPCEFQALERLCPLDDAIELTRRELPQVPRVWRRDPNGSETAVTGVRLVDLIAEWGLGDGLNSEDFAALVPIFHRLLPVEIKLRPDRSVERMEIGGDLRAPGVRFVGQLGVRAGPADAADIPAPPADPTKITTVGHTDGLGDQLSELEFSMVDLAREPTRFGQPPTS